MINKKYILSSLFGLFLSANSYAQFTISNGKHMIEISGSVSAYYNQRPINSDSDNQSRNKDRFKLRDAQLKIDGRIEDTWEYELQVDFADLAAGNSGVIDPENPGLMDASVTYKGLDFMSIKAGYSKLPYSRGSMEPFSYSPYWQRAELVRGDLFSRRDVGLTLSSDFWKQRVNVTAGMYTGMGEMSLRGDNDDSGNPEFVGRVDFAYPTRYRNRDVDDRHSPVPMFNIGVNARYANKTQPDGRTLPENSEGEYGWKIINGQKLVYGFDASFQYKGFSGQFEYHRIKGEPQSISDPLFQGFTQDKTKGYVLAGGYYAQLNYFVKPWNTILSARYERLNLNDLAAGYSERFSPAIAYQIKGYDAMIKFQYFNIMKEESIDPLRWKEQFRLGFVFNFK
jgi:phosphate-selective porin